MHKSILLLFMSVVFASCSSEEDFFKEKREFIEAKNKWESFHFDNYKVTERVSCFCYGVLVKDVFVKSGAKDKVEFDESTLPEGQTYEDVFNGSKTIEDAFLFIENLLNQDPDYMSIEYNAEYGFPTVISVDYDFDMADEEIAYIYNNFMVIN